MQHALHVFATAYFLLFTHAISGSELHSAALRLIDAGSLWPSGEQSARQNADIQARAQQVREIAVVREAPTPNNIAWCATYYDGTIAYAASGEHHSRLSGIECVTRPGEERTIWSYGAIDSVSLSLSGRYMALLEDNGRFAIISGHERDSGVEYWLPFTFVNPETGVLEGLQIGAMSWLPDPERLAVGYVDGRVILVDPATRSSTEFIPTAWQWEIESNSSDSFWWDSVQKSMQRWRHTGNHLYVCSSPGIRATKKVLAVSNDHYVATESKGILAVRRCVDHSVESQFAHTGAVAISNDTVVSVRLDRQAATCTVIEMTPHISVRHWQLRHTDGFAETGPYIAARGDGKTVLVSLNLIKPWSVDLSHSMKTGTLHAVHGIPSGSTINGGYVDVSTRAVIFIADIKRDGGNVAVVSFGCNLTQGEQSTTPQRCDCPVRRFTRRSC